jgi:hypothetical protein
VIDVEHMNDAGVLIDPVDETIGTAPSPVTAGERAEQWLANTMRINGKRSVAELQYGGSNGFREPLG